MPAPEDYYKQRLMLLGVRSLYGLLKTYEANVCYSQRRFNGSCAGCDV